MVTEIREIKDTHEVETQALTVTGQAMMIKVVDDGTYAIAGEVLKQINDMEKAAHDACDPICEKTDKAHKEAVALRNRIINPITDAKKYVKGQRNNYELEQERIRQEEERRLQEEARRAEEARRQAEIEEARRLREEEEARLLAEAQKAEAEGNTGLAEAIIEMGVQQVEELKAQEEIMATAPIEAPPVFVQRELPKTAGVQSGRTLWDAQVVDKMALIRAVATGQVSPNALDVNQAFLRQQATSLKETFKIPGCKAFSRRV